MSKNEQNALLAEALLAPFPDRDVKTYNAAKPDKPPRWFSYVEDETVMDRLDQVFGPGGWSITVASVESDEAAAIVTLMVDWPDTGKAYYSDFGHATNGNGETLKEAATDGIRRVARMVGIARYIYAGELEATPPPQQPQQPAQQQAASGDVCERHGVPWKGRPYDPSDDRSGRYHPDGVWEDSGKVKYCRHPGDNAAKKGASR